MEILYLANFIILFTDTVYAGLSFKHSCMALPDRSKSDTNATLGNSDTAHNIYIPHMCHSCAYPAKGTLNYVPLLWQYENFEDTYGMTPSSVSTVKLCRISNYLYVQT